jgi:hypothetical protein
VERLSRSFGSYFSNSGSIILGGKWEELKRIPVAVAMLDGEHA